MEGPTFIFFALPTAKLFSDCTYFITHNLSILECLKNRVN